LTHNPYGDHESREGLLVAKHVGTRGGQRLDLESETLLVAAPLSAGNNANSNAAGRSREDDINLVAFDTTQITHPESRSRPDDRSPQLAATAHPPAIAFQSSQSGERLSESLPTLDGNYGPRRRSGVLSKAAVRRLTPRECERLQGFPDDYTLIEYRGAPAKDAPRYKALGNSMAVTVMHWIGERIALVEGISQELAA